MIASVNIPGSSYFEHAHFRTRADCRAWLDAVKVEHQNLHGGAWASTYLPAQIVSEREGRSWRWRDGNPVCRCERALTTLGWRSERA